MSMNDPLAAVLSKIMNGELISRDQCTLKPISSVVKRVLEIMKQAGYVGEIKEVEDGRGNFIELQLIGKINKCGVIKPNFSVEAKGFEKFEKRFLPAVGFGMLIVTTPQGIMTHNDAKSKGIGGKLLAYVY